MRFPFRAHVRRLLIAGARRSLFIRRCVSFLSEVDSECRRLDQERSFSIFSKDDKPWRHPFLTHENIAAFRSYSESVWHFALDYTKKSEFKPLDCAFCVNIAQTSQNWAHVLQSIGAKVMLYSQPTDTLVISLPEWETFDGEWEDIYDSKGFLEENNNLKALVPVKRVEMDDLRLAEAYSEFLTGDRGRLFSVLNAFPALKPELASAYGGYLDYLGWARQLSCHDVVFASCIPIPAYLSGRPYVAFPIGWEMQNECGRKDQYGRLMAIAFAAARFIPISNPHMLGHCRRLGFSNALYVPYAMDDERFSPGEGRARREWEERLGPGVYVFSACRLDAAVKGYSPELLEALAEVARRHPEVRFVFLNWGVDAPSTREFLEAKGLSSRFLFLPPAGKRRIIDYYRSCDIVFDQFVYGYYGATALEAGAVGKPIVMKLRTDHYEPLYAGDVAPLWNAGDPREIVAGLDALANSLELRREIGDRTRRWLVRNHGKEALAPLMHALLRLVADKIALPKEFATPLAQRVTAVEEEYHRSCVGPR